MRCVDLFSGIGGFALACQANGIETACFVEKDQRCREFLSEAWPGVPIYDDVKTFDGTEWADAFLLTGGVPCQPASRAGKQRGAEDDRWLWPLADSERADARMRAEQGSSQRIGRDRPAIDDESLWSDFVWVPCADGKVRRAPGDAFGLVDGLHRSVLGALGNSIVWPVAAKIIEAMILSDKAQ